MNQLSLFETESVSIPSQNNLEIVIERLRNNQAEDPNAPIIVSYGGGTNSTAMLIWMVANKIKPDAILFADTGAEKPETYKFMEIFNNWLIERDFPNIETVRYEMKDPRPRKRLLIHYRVEDWKTLPLASLCAFLVSYQNIRQFIRYETIVEQSIVLETLPSKAYGMSSCSMQWKVEVIQSSAKRMFPGAKEINQFIGIHAGEIRRLLNANGELKPVKNEIFVNKYPLIVASVDQLGCNAIINATGLPVPPKSACWLCPNSKVEEVFSLKEKYPELYEMGCYIEEQAMIHNRKGSTKGLGRSFSWRDIDKLTPLEMAIIESSSRNCRCVD